MSAIDSQDRPLSTETDASDPYADEFVRLKREIIDAERPRSKWRKMADECYDFVAGHQWSKADEAILVSQNRPPVNFNRIAPLVKAVCGLEVNNRQGVVFLPRQVGSSGPNEMITNAGKWVRDECHAEDEESEAFRDNTICGEGWTEMRMDYEEELSGKITKERIDPREMGVNKGASRANYIDARMIYRIRDMDPDDVRALLNLPDDNDELNDAALDASPWLDKGLTPADGGRGNKKDYPDETPARVRTRGRGRRTTVRVVQCQYWKRETVNVVATEQDEEPQELDAEKFEDFKLRVAQIKENTGEDFQYEHTTRMKRVFYQCFIGMKILNLDPLKLGRFQFTAMTGERDTKEKYFYGFVRDTIDPQRWGNKFLAQTMNIMNANAKGGIMAETDAFVNVKAAERDWADPTKIIWAKPGSLAKNKIKERQLSSLPPGLNEMMMFAISSIRDVTGINLELLGQADREQAASLEQQRRQSAMTILATEFDNLRKYRKNDGKLMLQFIKLLPEGTLVRVIEKGQIQYIPLLKQDVDFEKFDVIIDQAPNSPDQKQFVWAITAQILQMNILPPQAIIELLKYSPYPESVVLEIRKALGLDGQKSAEQLQEQLQQAEEALKFLEEKLNEAQAAAKTAEDDRAVEMLKLEIEEYKAKTQRLEAQWKDRIDQATAIVDAASVADPSDEGAGGGQSAAQAQPSALEQKVDQLAEMMRQLLQTLAPQQQEAVPPPEAQPPMEPAA